MTRKNFSGNVLSGSSVTVAAAIVLLALASSLAWYLLFSNFRGYDDEGVLLMASRLFIDGGGFYTDIKWIYGPVQLATIRVLHDWMAIPIEHAALRYVTLAYWLLLCCASSILVFRLTRSTSWATATFPIVLLFTTSAVNEPGHPQALIAALTICVPLLFISADKQTGSAVLFCAGAVLGAIFHIKLNAGVFCLAALATVLLPRLIIHTHALALLAVSLVLASAAAPIILMYPLLSQSHCLAFAVLASTACCAVTVNSVAASSTGVKSELPWRAFASGFVVVSTGALSFAYLNGASPLDIFASLLSYADSHSEFYYYFREYSYFQLGTAALSLCLAIGYGFSKNDAVSQRIERWGKAYLVLACGFALITDSPATAQGMTGYAAPWVWLVAVGSSRSLARDALAALAAWSVLIAYPIPGSQLYFGSVLVLLSGLVCAADLGNLPVTMEKTNRLGKILRGSGAGAVAVTLVALSVELASAKAQYTRFKKLDLPGTGALAIEPQRARLYRKLVAQIKASDTLLTSFRSNSLSLWSGASMAGTLHHAHNINYATPAEQQAALTDLKNAHSPVVVLRDRPENENAASVAPLLRWVDKHFEQNEKLGPYVIMRPKVWPLNEDHDI